VNWNTFFVIHGVTNISHTDIFCCYSFLLLYLVAKFHNHQFAGLPSFIRTFIFEPHTSAYQPIFANS